MAVPTVDQIFSDAEQYYSLPDVARLLCLPCHTLEQHLDPDPRAIEILREINAGRLSAAGITQDSYDFFAATNPVPGVDE
jgi:hypothetical protein